MSARPNSRNLILDAAEQIVRERGATALTIDALALMTGIGKGGVLYHFNFKVDIIKAMLERHCERWESQLREDTIRRGGGVHAWMESFLEFGLHHQGVPERCGCSVIAAAAQKPALLEPLRTMYMRRLEKVTSRTSDPYLAAIILLAVDGLTFFSSISAQQIDETMREGIYNRLMELLQETRPVTPAIEAEAA
jgi:AcrR family transcriptional regulator